MLSTFIKLPFVIYIYILVLSLFDLPFKQDLLYTCRCTQSAQNTEAWKMLSTIAYNDFGAFRNNEQIRRRQVYVSGILCDTI